MTAPVLEARNISAGYGTVPVLRELDLYVNRGEIVAILGPNGAGKTTALLTLAGELKPVTGSLLTNGKVTTAPLHKRARQGLRFVTEERSVFPSLTVSENLRLGGGSKAAALDLFPELRSLLSRSARLLSGGEQQMLALARVLSAQPQLLLAEEQETRGPKGVGCEFSAKDVCYDLTAGRVVYRGARAYMPTIEGLTPDSVSLRHNRVTFKYSFK